MIRIIRVSAVTLAMGLVLAACSNSSDDAGSAGTTAGAQKAGAQAVTAKRANPADVNMGDIVSPVIALRDSLAASTANAVWDPAKIDQGAIHMLTLAIDGRTDAPVYWWLRDAILGARLALERNDPYWAEHAHTILRGVENATGVELEVNKARKSSGEPFRSLTQSAGDDAPIPTGPITAGASFEMGKEPPQQQHQHQHDEG